MLAAPPDGPVIRIFTPSDGLGGFARGDGRPRKAADAGVGPVEAMCQARAPCDASLGDGS